MLFVLFQRVWIEKKVPSEWKESLIIPIHKKGSKAQCGNYRGISLLSIPSKVLSRIIYNRLYPLIDNVLRDTQCGFRYGRSTTDMVFTARQLIEKALEQNTSLCAAFIDITKAFDSVDRGMLLKILEKVECPPNILSILKSLHDGTTASVRIENTKTPPFQINTGVKQGCVLAPLLFILYMQAVMENVYEKNIGGITIRFREDFNLFNRRNLKATTKTKEIEIIDLMFADDCALIARTPRQLQELLNIFAQEADRFGLKVNESKQK